MNDAPLLIVVGATASGKEQLALACAERLDAEIVSVDSMKIYRGLDVGTAKPSPVDRARVPHHALDLCDPTQSFSVADWVAAADAAIAAIRGRGRRVVLSGGTALYYKALLEGLFEGPGADPDLRRRLEDEADQAGAPALHARLAAADPAAARKIHPNDRRRLVRALEILHLTGEPISHRQRQWAGFHAGDSPAGGANGGWRYPFAMAMPDWPRAELDRRIAARVERMTTAGLVEEARRVWEARDTLARTPLQAVGYKEFFPYFAGEATLDVAAALLVKNTRRLAKAQRTWFKRFPATAIPGGAGPDAVLRAWGC